MTETVNQTVNETVNEFVNETANDTARPRESWSLNERLAIRAAYNITTSIARMLKSRVFVTELSQHHAAYTTLSSQVSYMRRNGFFEQTLTNDEEATLNRLFLSFLDDM